MVSSDAQQIQRLLADVTDAQTVAGDVVDAVANLGGPEAGDGIAILEELRRLRAVLLNAAAPPSPPEIVSRLMTISVRCIGDLERLRDSVDRASHNAIHEALAHH